MFEKPRKIDSLETLESYLSKKGGSAPGIYWEIEVERDETGEIAMETENPIKGEFRLVKNPQSHETSVTFQGRDERQFPDITISELDVVQGGVDILSRRKLK